MSGDALDALARAREAYRIAHPRRADAVDEAMSRDEDSEAVELPAGQGEHDPVAASEPLIACAECGREVDPYGRDVLREVIGWSRQREQGGQNHVRFRRETGRFMCPTCAAALKYAGTSRQTSLL